jgi:hypothetical protein
MCGRSPIPAACLTEHAPQSKLRETSCSCPPRPPGKWPSSAAPESGPKPRSCLPNTTTSSGDSAPSRYITAAEATRAGNLDWEHRPVRPDERRTSASPPRHTAHARRSVPRPAGPEHPLVTTTPAISGRVALPVTKADQFRDSVPLSKTNVARFDKKVLLGHRADRELDAIELGTARDVSLF